MAPAARRGLPAVEGGRGAGAGAGRSHAGRKQPWRSPEPHLARGSVQEGQGFAFWRKQKIQRDYKKLLKKERHAVAQTKIGFTENYPEHLKHLYLAEEEMLKKQRKPKNDTPVTLEETNIPTPKKETFVSNISHKKNRTKTSNQKAKEEYEKIKAERNRKKEAARKSREERENAQKLYKQKKMEAYKILSKRTRKGQPNLNVQMEYLLQKIQQKP